jgi:hypothetical protein
VLAIFGRNLWKIAERHLCKSGTYARIAARNIPRFTGRKLFMINTLKCFRTRTKKIRVLAAKFQNNHRLNTISVRASSRPGHPATGGIDYNGY